MLLGPESSTEYGTMLDLPSFCSSDISTNNNTYNNIEQDGNNQITMDGT